MATKVARLLGNRIVPLSALPHFQLITFDENHRRLRRRLQASSRRGKVNHMSKVSTFFSRKSSFDGKRFRDFALKQGLFQKGYVGLIGSTFKLITLLLLNKVLMLTSTLYFLYKVCTRPNY